MDYSDLTQQLMLAMHKLKKNKPMDHVTEMMHGNIFILKYLHERGGTALPSEISRVMGISTARVAASLNNLESKQLVNRETSEADRRKVLVTLTPKGETLVEHRHGEAEKHTLQMLRRLGEEDARDFVRILNKIADTLPDYHRKPEYEENRLC